MQTFITKNLHSTALVLCYTVLLGVSACAYNNSNAQSTPAPAQAGAIVQLDGTYQGWADCAVSSAKTRSDWVLHYVDAGKPTCVYVSGGLPTGIVPAPAKTSVGMPVRVYGRWAYNLDAKPYVQLVQP